MTSNDDNTISEQASVNDPDELVVNPTDHLMAIIDAKAEVERVLLDLRDAGFGPDTVQVFVGEEGARRIDASGAEHGFGARLIRLVQMVAVDRDKASDYAAEAEKGHFVLAIHCDKREAREKVIDILRRHEARDMIFFGKFQFEEIPQIE